MRAKPWFNQDLATNTKPWRRKSGRWSWFYICGWVDSFFLIKTLPARSHSMNVLRKDKIQLSNAASRSYLTPKSAHELLLWTSRTNHVLQLIGWIITSSQLGYLTLRSRKLVSIYTLTAPSGRFSGTTPLFETIFLMYIYAAMEQSHEIHCKVSACVNFSGVYFTVQYDESSQEFYTEKDTIWYSQSVSDICLIHFFAFVKIPSHVSRVEWRIHPKVQVWEERREK